MNNVISLFTLYEIFRIIVPGAYLVLSINKILQQQGTILSINFSEFEITFFLAVLSVISGIIIYSLDIAYRLKFVRNYLPSAVLKKEFANVDRNTIFNKYYHVYDNLHTEFKYNTEKHSNFYHLTVNLVFVNILLIAVFIVLKALSIPVDNTFLILFLIVGGLSFISAYLLYTRFVKNYLIKGMLYFKSSPEYAELVKLNKANTLIPNPPKSVSSP